MRRWGIVLAACLAGCGSEAVHPSPAVELRVSRATVDRICLAWRIRFLPRASWLIVERRQDGKTWVEVGALTPRRGQEEYEFEDTAVEPQAAYVYRIRALSEAASTCSNEAEAPPRDVWSVGLLFVDDHGMLARIRMSKYEPKKKKWFAREFWVEPGDWMGGRKQAVPGGEVKWVFDHPAEEVPPPKNGKPETLQVNFDARLRVLRIERDVPVTLRYRVHAHLDKVVERIEEREGKADRLVYAGRDGAERILYQPDAGRVLEESCRICK